MSTEPLADPVDVGVPRRARGPAEEVARHQSLGAEVLRRHRFWTVMAPPAGAPYCLTDRDPTADRTT